MSEAIALLAKVRSNPGFVAFSRVVGFAIDDGRSVDAYRMLKSIGAPEIVAHYLLEGWPLDPAQQRLSAAGITPAEEAAVRLACYMLDDMDTHDWSSLMRKACKGASAREERGGAQVSDPSHCDPLIHTQDHRDRWSKKKP